MFVDELVGAHGCDKGENEVAEEKAGSN